MTSTDMYIENRPTIQGKAREYWKKVPFIPLDEFESEANFTFVRCLNEFDSTRDCSFSTYLNQALKNNLSYLLLFFLVDWIELNEYMLMAREDPFLQDFGDWKKSLSEKSQEMIKIIFNTSLELISSGKNKITKNSLKEYLRKSLNWKFTDIQHCYNEISLALEKI